MAGRNAEPVAVVTASAGAGLELAGFKLIFKSDSPGIINVLGRRYAPFSCNARSGLKIDALPGPARVSPFKPAVSFGGGFFRAARGDFKAGLRLASGRGRLTAAPNEQCLDAFLRSLLSALLLRSGGLMLHSAGLAVGGRAYLFPGRSGAGKSTLAKLAAASGRRGVEVISDEINMVLPGRGGWRAHGSPFWGEMRAGGRRASWPLGGVFFPQKAEANSVKACPPAEAFRRLMRCVVNFSAEPEACGAALGAAAGLLASAPARRLAFSKRDASFLELIR